MFYDGSLSLVESGSITWSTPGGIVHPVPDVQLLLDSLKAGQENKYFDICIGINNEALNNSKFEEITQQFKEENSQSQ